VAARLSDAEELRRISLIPSFRFHPSSFSYRTYIAELGEASRPKSLSRGIPAWIYPLFL
jgi:hypothetical protein